MSAALAQPVKLTPLGVPPGANPETGARLGNEIGPSAPINDPLVGEIEATLPHADRPAPN